MQKLLADETKLLHKDPNRSIYIFDVDDTLYTFSKERYQLIDKERMVETLSSISKNATLAIATDKRTWSSDANFILSDLKSHNIEFCPELVLHNSVVTAIWTDLIYQADKKDRAAQDSKLVEKLAKDHYKFSLRDADRFISFEKVFNGYDNIFMGKMLYIMEILFKLGFSLESLKDNNQTSHLLLNFESKNLTPIASSRVFFVDDNTTCCRHAKFLNINVIYADNEYAIKEVLRTLDGILARLKFQGWTRWPDIDKNIDKKIPLFLEKKFQEALKKENREAQKDIAEIIKELENYDYNSYLIKLNPKKLLNEVKVQFLICDALLILLQNKEENILGTKDKQQNLIYDQVKLTKDFANHLSCYTRFDDEYSAGLKVISKELTQQQGRAFYIFDMLGVMGYKEATQEILKGDYSELLKLNSELLASMIMTQVSCYRADKEIENFKSANGVEQAVSNGHTTTTQVSTLTKLMQSWLNPFKEIPAKDTTHQLPVSPNKRN